MRACRQVVYLRRSQEKSEGVRRMKRVRRESQHKGMFSSWSPLWTTVTQSCWNFSRSQVEHASELSTQGTVYLLNRREDGEHLSTDPVPIGQKMFLGVLTPGTSRLHMPKVSEMLPGRKGQLHVAAEARGCQVTPVGSWLPR